MKVIHLLRKPCSEPTVAANVLRHGAGALNIDATRVVCEGGSPSQGRREGKVSLGNYNGWAVLSREGYKDARAGKTIGRWPANLVLQHLDGCVQDGTKKVGGNRTDTRPEGDGGRGDKTQWRFRPTEATRRGYSDPDGTETVAAWACAPGCPVAGLDEQSGVSKSTGGRTVTRSGGGNVGSGKTSEKSWSNDDPGFGDTGGASRFFKQVKA